VPDVCQLPEAADEEAEDHIGPERFDEKGHTLLSDFIVVKEG